MAMIPKQIYAGNILFFMPLIPKSSRITWMPIVEELATRKHNASSNKKILNFLKPKIAKKLIQQRSELMRILIVVKHLKPRKFQLAFEQ